MPVISNSFDLLSVEWRRVTDPGNKDFKVDFEYSLLGYDLPSGRLDMLLRYGKQGGHCRRHRHVAATVTLVLEGEQIQVAVVIQVEPEEVAHLLIRQAQADLFRHVTKRSPRALPI